MPLTPRLSASTPLPSIATAAEQQRATGEEISRAMGHINGISQVTSQGMAQSASAVSQMVAMVEQLFAIIQDMDRATWRNQQLTNIYE